MLSCSFYYNVDDNYLMISPKQWVSAVCNGITEGFHQLQAMLQSYHMVNHGFTGTHSILLGNLSNDNCFKLSGYQVSIE